ncbi:YbfB/YjiJ family MFS transporter [Asanoa sp. WMMD1127]|uniref:YbfB/YjiJ family MFS transporter n=1 Tax=Asanoa sp. WMMD1127 TaxID=3016107 RepID=UPI002415E865|nr:YbfB/YjiJ family MFS transporter [Asanoa sp. WMMD1127]MDG4824927.1 YbfB/YjiJ family MFS transporter [Asanoa sp. WMMD1127]
MTAPGRRALCLALGTASALGFGRFAYGLVLPAMAEDLHWDLARAGAMTAANGLGYLAGAVATATLARRIGVAATFRLGMVLCTVALAATAAGGHYTALLAARVLAGIAGALVFIAGAVLSPTAIYFAGAGAGILISGIAIPPLVDYAPQRWPLAWLGLAVAAGLATVASWTAAHPAGSVGEAPTTAPVRRLWPVATVYLLYAAGYLAYITFLSAYLQDRHASTAQTMLVWILLGVAVMAAPRLWQRPIRHWPGGRTLTVLLGVIAVATTPLLLWPTPAIVMISAIAYGVTFMAVPAAVTEIVRTSTPPESMTRTLSTFTVIFALGQMAGPWLAGALADRTTPGTTLGWTAAWCGAAAALAAAAVRAAPDGSSRVRGSPPVDHESILRQRS